MIKSTEKKVLIYWSIFWLEDFIEYFVKYQSLWNDPSHPILNHLTELIIY